MSGTPERADRAGWREGLEEALSDGRGPVHLIGVGNSIRTDDAVGLVVVRALRSDLGSAPAPWVKIHRASLMPERLLSKLAAEGRRLLIFDAVEAAKEPGSIVFSRLSETKYGFFATHNIPLRLVPGLAAAGTEVYILGVQPESLEVGEGLTRTVSESAGTIVEAVARAIGGRT